MDRARVPRLILRDGRPQADERIYCERYACMTNSNFVMLTATAPAVLLCVPSVLGVCGRPVNRWSKVYVQSGSPFCISNAACKLLRAGLTLCGLISHLTELQLQLIHDHVRTTTAQFPGARGLRRCTLPRWAPGRVCDSVGGPVWPLHLRPGGHNHVAQWSCQVCARCEVGLASGGRVALTECCRGVNVLIRRNSNSELFYTHHTRCIFVWYELLPANQIDESLR